MRDILSGNEAIARAAYESGAKVISSYPGTPSTEITEYAATLGSMHVEWATNEKVALEVIMGSSLAGARTLTAMKHVGLNVASDALMTFSYTGANGGAVITVADDPGMHSSQNEQDSRNYARFSKLPMLEPSDSSEALKLTKKAFEISEEYKCPVLVRTSTRVSHSSSPVELSNRMERSNLPYDRDIPRWVMVPANARKRHIVVEERLAKLAQLSNKFTQEYIKSTDIGIITSGIAYQYTSEALPDASILKLDMVWPLPINAIKSFAEKVNRLYVIEELDPIFETELKAAGIKLEPLERNICGELSVELIEKLFNITRTIPASVEKLPVRPPVLCAGCPHRGIFYALHRLKLNVLGDIGCYTLGAAAPLNAMDTCICMGAGVSMAHGFDKASTGNSKKSVAVIGDSTFLHTGLSGLINTVYNSGISTVVILDNRITGMTGHQPNAASGINIKQEPANMIDFHQLCTAIGVKDITTVDALDPDACINAIKNATAKNEASVILTNRPCIFTNKKNINTPYTIDKNNCSGCRACVRIGCPAISWNAEEKHPEIDLLQCTGCGLCVKLCKFNAIVQKGS